MTLSETVLLVEDDEDGRDAIADVLRTYGYTVVTAANGSQALDRLRECTTLPRVILIDLRMPVMDGWAFRIEQRKEPAWASIPVIALSGGGDIQSFDAAAHLMKPVQITPLIETVARFCSSPSRPKP